MKKFFIFAAVAAAMSLSLASCSQDEPAAAAPVAKTEVSRFGADVQTWAPATFVVNQETANSPIFKDLQSRIHGEVRNDNPAKFIVVDMHQSVSERGTIMGAMNQNIPIVVMYANNADQLKEWCHWFSTRVPEFNNVIDKADKAYDTHTGSNDHVAAIITQDKVIVIDMDGQNRVHDTAGYILSNVKYLIGEKE